MSRIWINMPKQSHFGTNRCLVIQQIGQSNLFNTKLRCKLRVTLNPDLDNASYPITNTLKPHSNFYHTIAYSILKENIWVRDAVFVYFWLMVLPAA